MTAEGYVSECLSARKDLNARKYGSGSALRQGFEHGVRQLPVGFVLTVEFDCTLREQPNTPVTSKGTSVN